MYECLCGMRRVVTVKNQFASFFCEFFWDVYLTGTAEQKEMHTFELHESTFYRLLCTIKGAKIISHRDTRKVANLLYITDVTFYNSDMIYRVFLKLNNIRSYLVNTKPGRGSHHVAKLSILKAHTHMCNLISFFSISR